MSRYSVTVALVVSLCALAVAGCAAAPEPQKGSGGTAPSTGKMAAGSARLLEGDSGKTVELTVGGTLVVDLEENATTGFTWAVRQPLPSVIASASDVFTPPTDTGVVGAAGRRVLTYDVKGAGEGDLTIAYLRPWEGSDVAAERTFTVHLVVK